MVSLDVEPNEDGATLRRYADQQHFDWRFAVPSPAFLRLLRDRFGTQFLNPPSEPMFIVDQRGGAHQIPFEHRDAGRLRELLAKNSAA